MSTSNSHSNEGMPKDTGDSGLPDSTTNKPEESSNQPIHEPEGETEQLAADRSEQINEEKRQRTLSRKAIHNAIQNKSMELNRATKALHTAADTVLGTLDKGTSHKELGAVLEPLQQAYTKYNTLLNEIEAFSEQDKWGETRDQINEITRSTRASAMYAYTVVDKAGSQQHSLATKPASIISKHTRHTRSSCTSVSSTHARRLALAEAAAAKKQSEFERIMAERESENKQREAEEEFHREQMRHSTN